MRSSNLVIKSVEKFSGEEVQDRATYKGVAIKCAYFIAVLLFSAFITAALLYRAPAVVYPLLIVSMIGAIVCSLIASFKPQTIKITGTLTVLFEGVLVGTISAIAELVYPGIVFAALMATAITFAVMITLYSTGIIKVGNRFVSFMATGLLAIVIVNGLLFLFGWFVPSIYELVYGMTWLSVAISSFMVLFAAFYLLSDLYRINQIVENGLDKSHEWHASFGLILTLVWLYMEILRLLIKIAAIAGKKK